MALDDIFVVLLETWLRPPVYPTVVIKTNNCRHLAFAHWVGGWIFWEILSEEILAHFLLKSSQAMNISTNLVVFKTAVIIVFLRNVQLQRYVI